MTIFEILLLSVGLAMDAFAVSICKGTSIKKDIYKKALIIGLWFSLFQALMPYIGYLFGMTFSSFVAKIDHFIAFFLLLFLGINMAYHAFSNDEGHNEDDCIGFFEMFILAVATSIDALAVGVTFSFFNINIYLAITLIGIISFILSFLGVFIGRVFENKFQKKAEIFGGVVLIIIAFKILFEHLGII